MDVFMRSQEQLYPGRYSPLSPSQQFFSSRNFLPHRRLCLCEQPGVHAAVGGGGGRLRAVPRVLLERHLLTGGGGGGGAVHGLQRLDVLLPRVAETSLEGNSRIISASKNGPNITQKLAYSAN